MPEKQISDASWVNVQDGDPEVLRTMVESLRAQVAALDNQVACVERHRQRADKLEVEKRAATWAKGERGAMPWAPKALVAWAKRTCFIYRNEPDDFNVPLSNAPPPGLDPGPDEVLLLAHLRDWTREFK